MHAKSDSEVTSLAASSPPRSPRSRPVYFVRDSSHSLLLPHSSRSHKSASRKLHKTHTHTTKGWAARNVIEEEGPDFSTPSKAPQIYTILLVTLSCAAFLFLFILLFWLICRPAHPELSLKNVVFHNFYMGEGADVSGVPTKMVSLNCTVQLNYYNPSKYFGVYVNPVAAELYYSELNIAKGEILKYYQQKGMRKTIPVVVQAVKVPIYGASAGLSSMYDSKHGIPLNMVATLHSQYYVVGKMVKPKFQNQVSCNIVLNSVTMALLTPLKSSCTYIPALPSQSNHR